MNGIDISSYQAGMDLYKIDCDFVIVKATEGNNYVNPYFQTMAIATQNSNKLLGFYHYINGCGAQSEMKHFYSKIKKYLGACIIALDWEAFGNKAWNNTTYLEECIKSLYELTGIKPLIYASYDYFPWKLAAKYDCGCWVAQYASNAITSFQKTPWNEGSYTCAIRQYSSTGRLRGYNANLDLNKAYMPKSAWLKYGSPKNSHKMITTSTNINNLVKKTLLGKYGNGETRKKKLGNNYNKVQKRINTLLTKAKDTKAGKYGNGTERKKALGSDYKMVQWIINNKLV